MNSISKRKPLINNTTAGTTTGTAQYSGNSSTTVWVTQEAVSQALKFQKQKENSTNKMRRSGKNQESADGESNGWHWISAMLIHTSSSGNSSNHSGSNKILQAISPNRAHHKSSLSTGNQNVSTIQIMDSSSAYNGSIVQVSNSEVCRRTENALYYNNNSKGKETQVEEPMSDISQLPHLNTPAIVDLLEHRYHFKSGKVKKPLIYTSTGGNAILIAVNPYCTLPDYYSERKVEEYRAQLLNAGSTKGGEPHVFHTAMCAYHDMRHAMDQNQIRNESKHDDYIPKVDQCILVSGESGAGKTVTTRYALQFLCHASANGANSSIQQQVLSSNPLLESFGNAHTRRNANSSRFGKFLTLHFQDSHKLTGADVRTYLLERKRVLGGYTSVERGFHVFHEFLAGAPRLLKKKVKITGNQLDYRITASGASVSDINVDQENWKHLINAMKSFGVPLQPVCAMLSAVLHLSNLNFSDLIENEVNTISELLGIATVDLHSILTCTTLNTPTDTVIIPLTPQQSELQRDAIIMTLYQGLFSHLVSCVNANLEHENVPSSSRISILDIFGFEWYDSGNGCSKVITNSLEQLCINYCNEILQRQFSNFALHLQYQEYAEEGLETTLISSSKDASAEVISCIERSLFAVINDMSLSLRGSEDMKQDDAITRQIRYESPILMASPIQQVHGFFQVKHYAGDVVYDTSEFLAKNNDVPLTSVLAVSLRSSQCSLMKSLSQQLLSKSTPIERNVNAKKQAKTTLQTFAKQLNSLIRTINQTQPHYIRCIKPNSDASELNFDRDLVVQQLRCNGVLEAVRVARLGFPHRMGGTEFLQRFSICSNSFHREKSQCPFFESTFPQALVEVDQLVRSLAINQDIQLGKKKTSSNTGKVFLTQTAYERVEAKRMAVMAGYAAIMTRSARCWLARKEIARRRLLKKQKEDDEKRRRLEAEQQERARKLERQYADRKQKGLRGSVSKSKHQNSVKAQISTFTQRFSKSRRNVPIPREDIIRRIHAMCHKSSPPDLQGLIPKKRYRWKLVGAHWTKEDLM